MRKFFFAMSLAFATISLQAWPTTSPSEAADPASQHETISGVVQKVDESGGKVTLEHGPIKSLGMDLGMTMVFAVQDTAQGMRLPSRARTAEANAEAAPPADHPAPA